MQTVLKILLFLLVAAGAYFGLSYAHTTYNNTWLTIYLFLFVALPLLVSTPKIINGRMEVKNWIRALMWSAAGLLLTTLVYKLVVQEWVWACLAGALVTGIANVATSWKTTMARGSLTMAENELKRGNRIQALRLAEDALREFANRSDRLGQADAETLLGIISVKNSSNTAAARYLNSALAKYRGLGQAAKIQVVESHLSALRKGGVDVDASAVATEAGEGRRVDVLFVLQGVLAIAFIMAFLVIWQLPFFQVTLVGALLMGVVLFLWVYGNYTVNALARPLSGAQRGNFLPLLLFNLAFVVLSVSAVSVLLQQKVIAQADFPEFKRDLIAQFTAWLQQQPDWLVWVAGGGALLLIAAAVSAASGRSIFGALGGLGGGSVTVQALAQAKTHIQAGAWTQAVLQLNRIDLATLKNPVQQRETLFLLGYAHHHAGHRAEARDYLAELTRRFPQDKEGLYLWGYICLSQDQLDEAEKAFHTLNKLDSTYNPGQPVRYYLSLVLYRKAAAVMEKDIEQGAALLSEMSRIGGLDKQVADALVRVHLYRCIQAVRAHDWATASSEAGSAQEKLKDLGALVTDAKELAKLRGMCMAASGLVAFKQENFASAHENFEKASTEVKSLSKKLDFGKQAGSFLEQMLRAYLEKSAEQGGVHPNFSRDLHFLAGVSTLRTASENAALSKTEAKKLLKSAAESMQASIAAAPQFVEGRAILGLIWFYLGEDKETREKGMEMLQSVRERVSSKFLNQTVADYEGEKQRQTDARKAYFDLLQQYLQFSNVPIEQRRQMRDRMRKMMEENGELESFVGRGSLEIEREEEPSVQEYANRTALLREKINALIEANRGHEISPNLTKLIEQLNSQNSELQAAVKTIADLEHQILSEAQRLL